MQTKLIDPTLYETPHTSLLVCLGTMALRIFAALHGMQMRSSDEKAVWPSLCQMHALWQNGRKICPHFYTIQQII